MRSEDILELVANGENSAVEFKRDDLRPEQLAREIVALANFQGGRVLLGVEDDGTISGIQRPDLEHWVMDTVFSRHVHPLILPFYEEVAMPDGRRVAIVSVTQGTSKPYVLRHNGREDIYIRVGSTSRLATREQQARLFESGGLLHAELLPVSGTRLSSLDQARLSDYLVNYAGDDAPPDSEAGWLERLTGLGLMVAQDGSAPVCTIAGLVLFGRWPRHSLRQSGIRWMSFAGPDMDYQAQDDTEIDGPLVPLWSSEPGQGKRLLEHGLVDRVLDRMKPFISRDNNFLTDGTRRESVAFYARDALREAILNALIHRDWTRALEVEIVNYVDRITITSPGALTNSMTLEKMLAGQRSPRNPIITEIMRDYRFVDMRGMGVRRKIVPLTRQWSGRDAEFEATEDFVRVTLPSAPRPA